QLGATTDPHVFDVTLGNEEHGLLQSFTYHVVAGDARSPEYRVEIITPPSATVTEVRYDYPEYMELDPRTQQGGAIDVWERSAVTITAATNVPVKRAEFELTDTEDFANAYPGSTVRIENGKKLTIAWHADPRQADGKFPKFYRIKVWDADGTPDPKPAVYPINVRLDQPPQVALIDPTTDLELPANGTVPLVVAARDPDFKLRTVSLKIALEENDITDEPLFDSEQQGAQQEIALKHDFNLEPLRLKAGDKIKFWIEAQDNRLPIHNLAKTSPLEITIKDKVSKEEAKKQLEEQKQQQQQKLDQAQDNNDAGTERPQQEPTGDNAPDQQPKDPMPRNANDPPNPDDSRQPQPNQTDKSQSGKPQPGDNTGKGQGGAADKQQNSGDKNQSKSDQRGKSGDQQSGKSGEPAPGGKSDKPSLKNDGSDDDKALERIAQRQNKNRPPQDNQVKQSSQSEAKKGSTDN
ncbi:MAG TPA: hypothetical protein VK137_19205, partial [Planctomycetaceae bacterium]|nr:hypothetical protein [Planctomycetaceae bacterium]